MTDQELEAIGESVGLGPNISKEYGRALLSRAIPEGHVVVPGWLPIESAPKDGTAVLLYTADGVIEGYWQQDRWEQYTIYCTYDAAGGPAFNAKPTHWMPLPAAPANKEGA